MHKRQCHPLWKRHIRSAVAISNYSFQKLSDKRGNDPLSSLTHRQLCMVMTIRDYTKEKAEGISLTELAKQSNISPPSASAMVNVLLRKGVLVRKHHSTDRRAVCISLSPALQDYLADSERLLDEKLIELSTVISEKHMRYWSEVVDILNRELAPSNQPYRTNFVDAVYSGSDYAKS